MAFATHQDFRKPPLPCDDFVHSPLEFGVIAPPCVAKPKKGNKMFAGKLPEAFDEGHDDHNPQEGMKTKGSSLFDWALFPPPPGLVRIIDIPEASQSPIYKEDPVEATSLWWAIEIEASLHTDADTCTQDDLPGPSEVERWLDVLDSSEDLRQKHLLGQCSPCAYLKKDDGCRRGADCRFCHLCTAEELKSRKKLKQKEMKEHKKLRKLMLSTQASPDGQPLFQTPLDPYVRPFVSMHL